MWACLFNGDGHREFKGITVEPARTAPTLLVPPCRTENFDVLIFVICKLATSFETRWFSVKFFTC